MSPQPADSHHTANSSSTHIPDIINQEKRNAVFKWGRRKPALTKHKKTILIILFGSIIVVALALGLALGFGFHHAAQSTPVLPIIDLGYARYQGSSSKGVDQWLGIRYAATPTGELRFAAPAPPPRLNGIQSATQHGSRCLSVRANASTKPSSPGQSEDCLFLEVYAPSNVTIDSNLPVYVYLQGGGFVSNAGTYNGASLIKASGMQIVVVNLNYRVGPHGFLASDEVRKEGSLNNGLKDQRQALRWVKDHIRKFGGNPNHVVLGGSSAGAASVTLQLAAYGGKDDGLFHATAAESQSFGALRTVEESQYQYDELVARTKCDSSHTKSDDTLACLRKLSSDDLQVENIGTPFPNTNRRPLFAYNPTLDHDFIPDYTLNLFSSGRFLKLPAIYGDTTNEGSIFYWSSTADAYGELRYNCPGLFLNNAYTQHGVKSNWNYRYGVLDPGNADDGIGTPHVAELNAIWGAPPGSPPSYKTTNKNMIPVLQQYWVSFIMDFDPNTRRLPGTPRWEEWGAAGFGDSNGELTRRNAFQNHNGKSTQMEDVGREQWERCKVLSEWGVGLGQ
ncbi:MAG: hypothetical protein L6R38_006641 [Xanthoria sp. 2 TBL-2021]|nr:MAG: hypothetical protein L6R38_006641 [Xanthoria sp. 2 TBL-2021]